MALHLHFGAGNLGIGAILGALSSATPLVVIQTVARPPRGEINWADVIEHSETVLLRNGLGRGFDERFDVFTTVDALDKSTAHRRLLVVERFTVAKKLVEAATSITCSLKDGQDLLVALLMNAPLPAVEVPVLVCENRFAKAEWDRLKAPWKVSQVVVDRICTDRAYSKDSNQIEVKCEEQCEIIAPSWARGVFNAQQLGTHFVPAEHIAFVSEKKARLVNSVQQVFALLAASAVRGQGVPAEKQSLSVAHALLTENPEMKFAFGLYQRIQAANISMAFWQKNQALRATPSFRAACHELLGATSNGDDIHDEDWCRAMGQRAFDRAIGIIGDNVKRFKKEADELSRLLGPPAKMYHRYEDNVLTPISDFQKLSQYCRDDVVYGWPKRRDVEQLRTYLTTVVATIR